MTKRSPLLLLLFGVIFQACIGDERSVPSSYIQPEEMKKILYECFVADAYNAERSYREPALQLQMENVRYYKKILHNYGVDSAKFFASMDYYTTHPGVFSALSDSLHNYAKRMGEIPVGLTEKNK